MSYIRYGEHGSNVYVYDQGDGEHAEPCCSGCHLAPHFVAHSWAEITRHLQLHRQNGDCIPDELMVALASDDTLPTHPVGSSILEEGQ